MNPLHVQQRPRIGATEFVSASKLLADTISVVSDQTHVVNPSGLHREQHTNNLRTFSVPSDPFEFEIDPFFDELTSKDINDELGYRANDAGHSNNQLSAISESSSEQQRLIDSPQNPYRTQRPWRIFPHAGANENEEEKEEEEEEWSGFEDTAPEVNFDLLPPPIASFESQEKALQSIQAWALDHGYALRIRDSKKRQKGDAYPYAVYFECDRAGKNQPSLKVDGKRLRKSPSRRRECPFRCMVGQPKKETAGL
jgi:hypothetical protein